MSDPYFNGVPWKEDTAYAAGDQVTYNGYRYEAMTATSAGDKPHEATYEATFSALTVPFDLNEDPPVPFPQQTLTMRKWKIWDYPASYIMARALGIPGHAEIGYPQEFRLVQVRGDYQYNGSPDTDLYLLPSSASYDGYGMPGGMDSNWGDPEEGELVWSFTAGTYSDGIPRSYRYNLGLSQGVVFSPTTIFPKARYDVEYDPGLFFWAFYPAYATETQGQLISCYQTFGRAFTFIDEIGSPDTANIPVFADLFNEPGNGYTSNNENPIGNTVGTDPDYKDG
jgi:hypothetical protein